MTKNTWRTRDIIAGLLVIVTGALFCIEALNYPLGSAVRAGPGFFPLALGLLMIALGTGIVLFDSNRAADDEDEENGAAGWKPRPLIALPLSILIFAVVVPRFGLGPATFLAVFTSTFADRDIGLGRAVIIALAVTAMCILIFSVGLGIQTRAFTW